MSCAMRSAILVPNIILSHYVPLLNAREARCGISITSGRKHPQIVVNLAFKLCNKRRVKVYNESTRDNEQPIIAISN